jgi:hypothetical protein
LAGSSAADAALLAEQTIAAETLLAQWQVDEPAFPDALGPEPVALTALEAEYPNVPWRRFLERLRSDCAGFGYVCNEELLGDSKLIVMGAPHFFSQLSSALGIRERSHGAIADPGLSGRGSPIPRVMPTHDDEPQPASSGV